MELGLTTWHVPMAEGAGTGSQHGSVGLGSSLHHGNLAMWLGPEAELNRRREVDNNYPQTHHIRRTHMLLLSREQILSSLMGRCKSCNGRTQGLFQIGPHFLYPLFLPSISLTLC